MPNIPLVPKNDLPSARKLALGTWRTTYDPSVYGSMSLNMDKALEYIEAYRQKTGQRLTVTHMIAKAVGKMLEAMPDANAIIRFNKIYLRQDISVFFQVAMEDPETGQIDLSGVTVREPQKKTLSEIVSTFEEKVQQVREFKDKELEETRGLIKRLPFWLLKPFLSFIGFLSYTLNLDLRKFGLPKDAFGSAMVTNIGSLGLEEAYVPLVPYSRVPLLIALGAVKEIPMVQDGKVVIGKNMRVFATFDHRILDGAHASTMSKVLKQYMEDPFNFFDSLED